jgi:hypothetical protein
MLLTPPIEVIQEPRERTIPAEEGGRRWPAGAGERSARASLPRANGALQRTRRGAIPEGTPPAARHVVARPPQVRLLRLDGAPPPTPSGPPAPTHPPVPTLPHDGRWLIRRASPNPGRRAGDRPCPGAPKRRSTDGPIGPCGRARQCTLALHTHRSFRSPASVY